ncbi:MAG: 4Fe-4S binding protein [Campylobacter hominis]|uniref:4Fe-4S binding protein n=1 Tax=Campylobacter sp. TaxID=205 RepID=UPI002588B319|nr:4Fe-4S binding protein [Campylobacter sp.]MDD7422024.1 4Fe-4S binding protein [Campylobacter hominis]
MNFEVLLKSIKKNCVGCDTCRGFCPTEAIEGSLGIAHKISINKCVNCAQCLINCLFGAI